jgi:hypothetical protein
MAKVKAVRVLRHMKTVLARGWVKGYYAKTGAGRICKPDSKRAVGYCISGARIVAVKELDATPEVNERVKRLIKQSVPRRFTPEEYNDAEATTKADVLRVVDKAISLAPEGW